jgi:hypothetical protein
MEELGALRAMKSLRLLYLVGNPFINVSLRPMHYHVTMRKYFRSLCFLDDVEVPADIIKRSVHMATDPTDTHVSAADVPLIVEPVDETMQVVHEFLTKYFSCFDAPSGLRDPLHAAYEDDAKFSLCISGR